MTAQTVVAGMVQVVGGVAAAPLLVGLTQQGKALLQGRRGPGPLQPYRELRRLWGKSAVDVDGSTIVYRLAPVLVAAATGAAILLVPAADRAPGFGVGHDALALAGLLALARLAVCAAAWDVSNGFALQGASRDLTLSVFVEAALVLSLAVAALVAGTTDLRGVVAGNAGFEPWSTPALALGAAAFLLVVIAETGRQPVDNPDTHLELTMIHEVMVLDHGGPDFAFILYGAAMKLFLFGALLSRIVLGHAEGALASELLFFGGLLLFAVGVGLVESAMARLRMVRVPQLLVGASVLSAFALVLLLR